MEQPKLPDEKTASRSKIYSELESKIKNLQVVTLIIPKDRLPFYLRAASATGFKVEKIADEGQEFPFNSKGVDIREPGPQVSIVQVNRKGCIAVYIEKPESSKDYSPFWNNLRSLEQKKV